MSRNLEKCQGHEQKYTGVRPKNFFGFLTKGRRYTEISEIISGVCTVEGPDSWRRKIHRHARQRFAIGPSPCPADRFPRIGSKCEIIDSGARSDSGGSSGVLVPLHVFAIVYPTIVGGCC